MADKNGKAVVDRIDDYTEVDRMDKESRERAKEYEKQRKNKGVGNTKGGDDKK